MTTSRHPKLEPWCILSAGVLVCLLAAAAGGRADPAVTELDELPAALPYLPVVDPVFDTFPAVDTRPPFVTGDLDQDGWPELVMAAREGFVGWDWEGGVPGVLWQQNYPVAFLQDGQAPYVCLYGLHDIDGDGQPEVLLTAGTVDRGQWRLWAYDPRRDAYDLDWVLPGGPDRKADGIWDGCPRIVGVLTAEETGAGEALLMAVQVGYDLEPRGLMALGVRDGRVLWQARMGTNPDFTACRVVDVDGDGERDILLVGGTSNNMPPGMVVEETRDDQCVLFRYDTRGRRLWWRELGRGSYGAALQVVDLDGDGAPEIITGDYDYNPGGNGTIRIWGADGRLRARKVLDGLLLNVQAAPAEGGGAPGGGTAGSITVGSTSGQLSRLTWDGRRLTLAGRALSSSAVYPILEDELIEAVAGAEVVVKTAAGTYVVLDRELGPLAALAVPDGPAREIPGLVWNAGPGHRYLLARDRWTLARRFEAASTTARAEVPAGTSGSPAPGSAGPPEGGWVDAIPDDAWRLAAGLVAVAGAGGIWSWRTRRSRARREAAGRVGADRERLAALLRSLEQSSHGAVAVTSGVRRLAWLLEALASGVDASGSVRARTRQTWADFRESVRPQLLDVLALAQGTPCGGRAGQVGEALVRFGAAVERALGELEAGKGTGSLPAARQAAREVEDGFADLRREVESYFTVDLRKLLDRVLLLRQDELVHAGLRVRLGPPEAPAALPCRVDPADLRFAVDNLVGNAVEAMLGGEAGELTLRIAVADGLAVLEVGDTGCGIEPERRRTLFEPRGGGLRGLGLCRSRELLRRWGGDVELVESEPGRGSRFRLRVPLAVRSERTAGHGTQECPGRERPA